jgi:UDP-N-acetylmuramate: L-alanyl-gamma-D-glutamyl-meso-diaminopimelate ligase
VYPARRNAALERQGHPWHDDATVHVHFIAVAGTGMGALAGLFKAAGHDVSGSDVAFYPPMGPALERWGVRLHRGFLPENLDPKPDLVVVGNVCRRDNPEARAAIDGGLTYASMVGALADNILSGTSPLVVGGTHGKTTTSSMCAWILEQADKEPGFLIGGIPKNFDASFQLPARGRGGARLPLANAATQAARKTPFVVEGDEYDTAFFEKTPKFWHYRPEVAIVTSIEHDHIDIYPDEASYLAAFAGFIQRVPEHGLVVANAADGQIVELIERHAKAPVAWYAIDGDDTHDKPPHWLASPANSDASGQAFDLFAGGTLAGRGALGLSGRHNLANATAAIAACSQGFGVPVTSAMQHITSFEGVARRQDLRGEPDGVRVYDDFAHHPTAVKETLRGLKRRHPDGTLWAVYEPRTATACRALHQAAYLDAFGAADQVVLSPLGRSNIPQAERLDLGALAAGLAEKNVRCTAADSIDAIVALLAEQATTGDTIALLSNGAFGGIHERLLEALAKR